jgi:hypothetical protein
MILRKNVNAVPVVEQYKDSFNIHIPQYDTETTSGTSYFFNNANDETMTLHYEIERIPPHIIPLLIKELQAKLKEHEEEFNVKLTQNDSK